MPKKYVCVNIATTGLDPTKHGILRAVVIVVDAARPDYKSETDYLIDPGSEIEVEAKAMAIHKSSGLFARYSEARKARKLTPIAELKITLRGYLDDGGCVVLGQGGWALPWIGQMRYLDPTIIADATQLQYPKIESSALNIEVQRAWRDAKLIRDWLRLFTPDVTSASKN